MLEAQLTRLVKEIGQMRFVVDRVPQLERELRAKDLQISEIEAEADQAAQVTYAFRPAPEIRGAVRVEDHIGGSLEAFAEILPRGLQLEAIGTRGFRRGLGGCLSLRDGHRSRD